MSFFSYQNDKLENINWPNQRENEVLLFGDLAGLAILTNDVLFHRKRFKERNSASPWFIVFRSDYSTFVANMYHTRIRSVIIWAFSNRFNFANTRLIKTFWSTFWEKSIRLRWTVRNCFTIKESKRAIKIIFQLLSSNSEKEVLHFRIQERHRGKNSNRSFRRTIKWI